MSNNKYVVLDYKVKFLTPAFLGNAEQNGQWRTPPFKALLRQWWRVVYAANKNFQFDLAQMRHDEGVLFGHAWLDDDKSERDEKVAARKSLIRIRLDDVDAKGLVWKLGSQRGVEPLPTGLDTSYAWFGLIKRGGGVPDRMGIKPNTNEGVRRLRIALPEVHLAELKETIALINAFGLLGSRSRGGWGALQLDEVPFIKKTFAQKYAQPLKECLTGDWAMSLAVDAKGLMIWRSRKSYESWDGAMRFIAMQRKNVRSGLKTGKDLRPALGFATPQGRMPSPLRWKLIVDSEGKLQIQVFALPHAIPQEGNKHFSSQALETAWRSVSDTLDYSFERAFE